MALFNHFKSVVRKLKHEGVREAARTILLVLRCKTMKLVDGRRIAFQGLDTGKSVPLNQLVIDSENGEHGFSYVASPPTLVRTLLRNLPDDLSDYIFIDFGSGKGPVFLLASCYGFRKVVGVEFSGELHNIAKANIERFSDSRRRCQSVHCFHLDATQYAIPDSPCVLYFNNPFDETVMSQVLRNVEEAFSEYGHPIYILYQQLRHEPESDRTLNIQLLQQANFLREQTVQHESLFSRLLLGSHLLKIFRTL